MPFTLRISTPLVLGQNPIVLATVPMPELTGGTFTSALQGGWGTLQVDIRPGALRGAPAGAHVELVHTSQGRQGIAWAGQLTVPKWVGLSVVSLQAKGYGLAADDAFDGGDTVIRDATECLRIAMRTVQPLLRPGPRFDQVGLQHSMDLFNDRGVLQIAEQLATENGYDYAVYDRREVTWVKRQAPDPLKGGRFDYSVPESLIDGWEPDFETIFTAARVTWTDYRTNQAGAPADWTDADAEARFGIHRRQIIQGGTTDSVGALASAQTFVALHLDPTVRATVGPAAELLTPEGATVPGPLVRSGQWLDVQHRSGQIIVQTSCTIKDEQVTAQLGAPRRDAQGTQATLTRFALMLKAGSNLNTGAKA